MADQQKARQDAPIPNSSHLSSVTTSENGNVMYGLEEEVAAGAFVLESGGDLENGEEPSSPATAMNDQLERSLNAVEGGHMHVTEKDSNSLSDNATAAISESKDELLQNTGTDATAMQIRENIESQPSFHTTKDDRDEKPIGVMQHPPYPISVQQQRNDQRNQWTPSRQSTVSSIGGNSIDCDTGEFPNHMDNVGSLVLLGGHHNFSNLSLSDEKSTRSENSRPDPPSIQFDHTDYLEQLRENDHSNVPDETTGNFDRSPDSESTGKGRREEPAGVRGSTVTSEQRHRHFSTAEEFVAVEALATLSTNVAEMTLLDSDEDGPTMDRDIDWIAETGERLRSEQKLTWDINREALMAETPEGVTIRKSAVLIDKQAESSVDHEDTLTPVEYRPPLTITGADDLIVLPRVDENRFYSSSMSSRNPPHQQALPLQLGQYGYARPTENGQPPTTIVNVNSGRRKIKLRLQEEVRNSNSAIKRHFRSGSLLGTIRKSSTRMLRFGGSSRSFEADDIDPVLELYKTIDRGSITVSWFEGTSSLELQQHVRKSVLRKLQLISGNISELDDLRFFDEGVDPPEEVVLTPYMPDGSQFLLRFSTSTLQKSRDIVKEYDGTTTPMSIYSGRAPDSPSQYSSPHLEKYLLGGLNASQLALLNSLSIPAERARNHKSKKKGTEVNRTVKLDAETRVRENDQAVDTPPIMQSRGDVEKSMKPSDERDNAASNGLLVPDDEDDSSQILHSEDPIETRLREITNLLLLDRKKARSRHYDRHHEKRQVVFVVANYFVLFLAIIAISAELQARAPNWLRKMEEHLQSVQNCSENQEALFECVSRGDLAGLVASVVLWLSRSVATKRVFLFGFDSPKKLWTVVYESLVTSICWGISYLFIRRGMNPDTRPRFVQKYWKDAVYGSLAGFNAAFLKHILKNLIPEQVVEDVLRERQLKILGWLPSFSIH